MDRAFEREPRLRKDSVLFLREASKMMEESNESMDDAFVTLRRLCTTCHAFARVLSDQDTFLTHLQIFYNECNRDRTRSLILALVRVAISSNPRARESFDVDSNLYKTYRIVYSSSFDEGSSSKALSSSWTCTTCTYKNTKNSSKCEMCETSRPVKTMETKHTMKNRTTETIPKSSWTGKRSEDEDVDEDEKQNAELKRKILSVYNAYDDDGDEDEAIFGSGFSIGMENNKNHGDQAKTQSERILRDAEDRERESLMAEAPSKIMALHEELERLGPNDREAIKTIRKRIERWKTLCIPTTAAESTSTTKMNDDRGNNSNSSSSSSSKNGDSIFPKRYTRADGKKKGSFRRRKNQNKASIGNHNRKKKATRKLI